MNRALSREVDEARYRHGLEVLTAVDGEAGEKVVAALADVAPALGGCEPQLEVHVGASLNVGLTPSEISEALIHSAVYCGFPRALNAVAVAKRVFADRGLLPVGGDVQESSPGGAE